MGRSSGSTISVRLPPLLAIALLAGSLLPAGATPVPPAPASLAIEASADASVDRFRPTRRFGKKRGMKARRGRFVSYLRFRVPQGLEVAGGARLRLFVTNGSADGLKVRAVKGWWAEGRVRWRTRPRWGPRLGVTSSFGAGSWAEVDLGAGVGPGSFTVGVVTRGRDRARFVARHGPGSLAPVLELTWSPPPTPPPTPSPSPSPEEAPVIAAAGDIACDPADPAFADGMGTASRCHQMATSDLVVGGGYDAVLPLGDTQYEYGELDDFAASYDPSWGRVRSITRPVIGNHENWSAGGGEDATGYFTYFGEASSPDTQGIYSYDLGAWHLIALNSTCGVSVRCDAGSDQVAWLENDLAASEATCTLAYFHHPRWTSGTSYHPGIAEVGPFWEALHAAGADVVLSGHEHVYERFAPMAPDGSRDDLAGIRQFVVGTGGKSLRGFVDPPLATSEQRLASYGILELTLRDASYDWRFLGEDGGVLDQGTDDCA